MTGKRILAVIAILVLGGALLRFYAGHQTRSGQPPLAELNPDKFTTAFNTAKDEVRVLLFLSPLGACASDRLGRTVDRRLEANCGSARNSVLGQGSSPFPCDG